MMIAMLAALNSIYPPSILPIAWRPEQMMIKVYPHYKT
jgi:hypothetical protein